MAKETKRKLLFITVILSLLFISSTYAALIPNVHAADMTAQQKRLSILNEVVGLDLTKYVTAWKECPQDLYLEIVPQENVRYTLDSNGSKVDMLYTFANGNLRMIQVLESEGPPHTTKSVADAPEMAKGFLASYQSYSGKALYGELKSILDYVETDKNLTKTTGNVKLEATASGNSATFRWTFTVNGIEAPDKCVALHYENGFLNYFIDNWDLYKIGSSNVNLTENEAIEVAMERARTFSYKVGTGDNAFEVKNFNVAQAMVWQTVFWSSLCADTPRNKDLLMLYPVRHVWVSLDKFYPGNVYGIEVYFWADTGEVCHMQERFSTLDPPADKMASFSDYTVKPLSDQISVDETRANSMSPAWIALPAFATVMLITAPVWLGRKKKCSFKVGGLLLCLLISSMLLIPIEMANAVEPTRRAVVWGSESTGDTSYYGSTGRKTQNEINQQRNTAGNITSYFNNNGYYASDYQGSGSIKAQILNNISYNEANYARVAVVDFDHGVGNYLNFTQPSQSLNEFHYMFEDNIGTKGSGGSLTNGVYDYEIHPKTACGKTFFAFINTCLSANITAWNQPGSGGPQPSQGYNQSTGRAVGMPYAWTHRLVKNRDTYSGFNTAFHMSDNGYSRPDHGAFCYIGFPYGSASLCQTVEQGSAVEYYLWLKYFFACALSNDITVIQALNHASQNWFSENFDQTDLYNDFEAKWPMWNGTHWNEPPFAGSKLVVYGNGNIRLHEYYAYDVVETGTYGSGAVYNPNGLTGAQPNGDYARLYAPQSGDQAVIVANFGYQAWENAHGDIYLRCYSETGYESRLYVYVSDDYQDWTLTSRYPQIVYSHSPSWLYCGAAKETFKYIAIAVYRDPNSPYGSDLRVDSVLVVPPINHNWAESISDIGNQGNGYVENPEYLLGDANDGNLAILHTNDCYDESWVIAEMNVEVANDRYIYLYGCGADYAYGCLSVYVSNDYQSWTTLCEMTWVDPEPPHWIYCGYTTSPFRYIKIHNLGIYSYGLCIDSVFVTA